MSDKPNVVFVHGGFVDGSGWQGVYDLLTADGYSVGVVQNPTLSLEGDAQRRAWSSTARTGRRSSWDTPTAGQSSPRPGRTKASQDSPTSPPSLPMRASQSTR